MNTHKLTKVYYYPVVKGSQFGLMAVAQGFKSAFQSFIKGPNGSWLKITNYNNIHNYFFDIKISFRYGYLVFGKEQEACLKANKYLSKQYGRMAKALFEGNLEKYHAIFETLSKRSRFFQGVLFVRKLRFYSNNYTVSKAAWMLEGIRKKVKSESTKLKFKRVFLPEYNSDGTLKKYRPLGVPSVEWRVIAAMYEFYLVNLMKKDWNPNQYACMPNIGVVDAWIQILSKVKESENIVGIDLAKFFDTVYLKTVSYVLGMSKVSERVVNIIEGINNRKPQVKDKTLEIERIKQVNEEAPVMLYPPVEDFMSSVPEHNWNSRDRSLPQGLSTSPLLACSVLNETGAIVNEESGYKFEVIQYVDDAIIMGSTSVEHMLRHYKQMINPYTTGIHISEKKTEVIKENGQWIKPLKFLGCEYDGRTFKAHTRKGGVYEVSNASQRIEEIIRWLHLNRKSIVNYPRKELSSLINQSWNHQPTWMLLDPNRDLSRWEKERIITTKIGKYSIEGRVISKYLGTGLPIIGSSNTMSMLCAGELLLSLNKLNQDKIVSSPTDIGANVISKADNFEKLYLGLIILITILGVLLS